MGEERTKLVKAVETMVNAVVSHGDEVEIRQTEGGRGPVICVKVNARDRGRLIGRQGRTIQAMRAVLGAGVHALGEASKGLPTIEVEEPQGR